MIPKKHRRWIIYLISCLLFTFSQFYRSSIAVISPNLVDELNLDTEDLGLISAAFFYAFAAMQIPVGIYLDSVGPRVLMAALSIVAVVGATMFACGESAVALIVGRLFLGVGMACNLMGPLKLITNALFGGCLVFTGLLYGLTVDGKNNAEDTNHRACL